MDLLLTAINLLVAFVSIAILTILAANERRNGSKRKSTALFIVIGVMWVQYQTSQPWSWAGAIISAVGLVLFVWLLAGINFRKIVNK